MAFGAFGASGYDGATRDRLYNGQPTYDLDVNDINTADATILGARACNLMRNNGHAITLVNSMKEGAIGAEGIKFKSQYHSDDLTNDENKAARAQIDNSILRATLDKRLDVAGLLSYRQIQDSFIYGKAGTGEAMWVRVYAPNRPNSYHSWCWRHINPLRISNPRGKKNGKHLFNGVVLNGYGTPIAIWVASRHPNSVSTPNSSTTWKRIPLYDENGLEKVIWDANRDTPEQIRGISWFAPIMGLIMHLGNITEAHVVAKRLQACMGMIIECTDPYEAAKADQNGEVLTSNTEYSPGKTYYVKTGYSVKPFDFKYQGDDFRIFTDAIQQIISSSFGSGMPADYAFRQLTKANMASSRAALMQAWRSFRRQQVDIECSLRIIIKNIVSEDIGRGRITLATDDLDDAIDGYFVPPPRLVTDEHRELQGAKLKSEVLHVSNTTLCKEYGYDAEKERKQRALDAESERDAGFEPTPVAATTDEEILQYNRDNPDDDEDSEDDNSDENKKKPIETEEIEKVAA